MKLAAAGGTGLFASKASAVGNKEWQAELLKYLCPPDNRARELNNQKPSPFARPWATPLYVPAIMEPTYVWDPKDVRRGDPASGWKRWHDGKWEEGRPDPLPDPQAHQRYEEFHPRKLYEIHEVETRWRYHVDPPYTLAEDVFSYSWCWHSPRLRYLYDPKTGEPVGPDFRPPSDFPLPAFTPGPTYRARYGEPVLVRRYNSLPSTGLAKVFWALPSTTSHLHNGHTASESDGNPQDWIDSGEFWDHHYANFPLGFDPREKLTTLWYHDHRLDFTAANVYAGLAGFYTLFDDDDTGDERTGWRLPSGRYDVPLILQDVKFEVNPGIDPTGAAIVQFDSWNTDGQLGDHLTVNRCITPHFKVERRKYRFRFLNGGPSRFYQLFLRALRGDRLIDHPNFLVLTGDGNFHPEPLWAESVFFGVAQRVDVIMDFSRYQIGDQVYVHNLLEQVNGAGPSGRYLDWDDPASFLLRFDVEREADGDESRVPSYLRPLPKVDLAEVKQKRRWVFDYDGGLWTINGRVMDPNRIDAGIEQGTAEIWDFVNGGNDWSHPIHSHFSEFLILEVNGRPFKPRHIQTSLVEGNISSTVMDIEEYLGEPPEKRKPLTVFMGGARRDVANLLPGDEVKLFMRWKDFLGKHVMHCHNVVHEDHAMMIRWDIVEPGRGFLQPKEAKEVYDQEEFKPPFPDPRPPAPDHLEERPSNPTIQDG
jgi:FtsP/CotA-like multicopper oxidase with cupredoxin domain